MKAIQKYHIVVSLIIAITILPLPAARDFEVPTIYENTPV